MVRETHCSSQGLYKPKTISNKCTQENIFKPNLPRSRHGFSEPDLVPRMCHTSLPAQPGKAWGEDLLIDSAKPERSSSNNKNKPAITSAGLPNTRAQLAQREAAPPPTSSHSKPGATSPGPPEPVLPHTHTTPPLLAPHHSSTTHNKPIPEKLSSLTSLGKPTKTPVGLSGTGERREVSSKKSAWY